MRKDLEGTPALFVYGKTERGGQGVDIKLQASQHQINVSTAGAGLLYGALDMLIQSCSGRRVGGTKA